ncbi:ABC transporter permease [Companilactobacillus crustorum]|uniref:ABC transporter permease n=1 Tax=Companilactobacillus crustorum TaxID=392416 RepID=UPI00096A2509|nr:ABC transporter permease [Companilactobacillus crustorum]
MITLIKQESYKIIKQKGFKIFLISLPIFQFIVSIYTLKFPNLLTNRNAFSGNFYAFIPIAIYLITIGSTMISYEVQYGTLRALIYRKYSRYKVLSSKFITVFILSIILYFYSNLTSFVIKLVFFNSKIRLSERVSSGKTIFQTWVLTNVSQFLSLWFLMSIVFLLGTMFSSSSPAITSGIIGYFVLAIFNQVFFIFIDKYDWLKWNPLNMLNLGAQIENSKYSSLTHLNMQQISFGYSLYVVLFLCLAFISFRKRKI